MHNTHNTLSGFTLLELLSGIAIIAILSSIAFTAFNDQASKGEVTKAVMEIKSLANQISAYQVYHGGLPLTLADMGTDDMLDPWGNAYIYLPIDGIASTTRGDVRKDRNLNPINTDFDLYSMGPDGETRKPLVTPQGKDDIIRAGSGSFYGIAENF